MLAAAATASLLVAGEQERSVPLSGAPRDQPSAAESRIAGRVSDARTGIGVEGAAVELREVASAAPIQLQTDNDGRFAARLRAGHYVVRVTANGYLPATYGEALPGDGTPPVEVVLQPERPVQNLDIPIWAGGAIERTILDVDGARRAR